MLRITACSPRSFINVNCLNCGIGLTFNPPASFKPHLTGRVARNEGAFLPDCFGYDSSKQVLIINQCLICKATKIQNRLFSKFVEASQQISSLRESSHCQESQQVWSSPLLPSPKNLRFFARSLLFCLQATVALET